MYDYLFIGAGPATLVAAYILAKQGYLVRIIDKGRPIEQRKCIKSTGACNCKPCNILCGAGGAGCKSDFKLCFSPKSGGDLYKLGDKETVDLCIEKVKLFYETFSGFKSVENEMLNQGILYNKSVLESKCLESGLRFIAYPEMHIGSDNAEVTISNIIERLKYYGIKIDYGINAEWIDHSYIDAKNIVYAIGRAGYKTIQKLVNSGIVNGSYKPIDIGVRFETLNSITNRITHIQHDFKIINRYKDFQVRSFCVNPQGYVATERHDQYALVNGYSEFKRKSNNCNFAILLKCELTDPSPNTIEYGENIAKTFNDLGGGKPLVQRLEDIYTGRRTTPNRLSRSNIIPTLHEAVPGDLNWAMPPIVKDSILDYIHKLNSIMPGIDNGYNSLVYFPEIKFQSLDLDLNKDFSSKLTPQISFIGDCSGKSGSIVSASVMGMLFALRQINPEI